AGIVEFELIDADEFHLRQIVSGPGEAERPDEIRVFDERAESGGFVIGMPGRREQVGLAHAVAAVEVDALGTGLALREQTSEETGRRRALGELAQLRTSLLLGRLVRIGAVAVEGDLGELRRRNEPGDELFGCYLG